MNKHNVSLFAVLVISFASLAVRADGDAGPTAPPTPAIGKESVPDSDEAKSSATELKALLQDFQYAQASFKQEQDDLRRKLSASNRQQREALRERLQSNREKWLEEVTKLQEDLRDRLKELRLQLVSHSDLVEDAKERVKDHRGK